MTNELWELLDTLSYLISGLTYSSLSAVLKVEAIFSSETYIQKSTWRRNTIGDHGHEVTAIISSDDIYETDNIVIQLNVTLRTNNI